MKKLALYLSFIFMTISSLAFAANQPQNFNFTYKWNLPDIAISGFTKDKQTLDKFLVEVEKSKYSKDWSSLTSQPTPVGNLQADKLSAKDSNDKFSLSTSSNLYIWLAVRSLQSVKVTLEGSALEATYTESVTGPEGQPSQVNKTHQIDYKLGLTDVSVPSTAIITPDTLNPHIITITNILGVDDIFGTFVGQISITATLTDFVPYSYKGNISLNISTV